jgi:hypothetical protein
MTSGNRVSVVHWIGISTDTKPTSPATGSTFFETDTGRTYYYNSSAWVEQVVSSSVLTGTLGVASGGTGAATHTAGILKGSGTSAFTTVAAPAGAVVGTTDSQTLTTKTINANTNTFGNLIQNPFYGKKYGAMYHRGSTSGGIGHLGNGLASTILVGAGPPTATTITNDANGIGCTLDTSATINNLAGWKCTTCVSRQFNPVWMLRFKLVATAAFRFFAGFSSGASSNPASNSDYLNAISGVGLWVDSAVSANWKVMNNDGSGASTVTDTTVAFDALIHTLTITGLDSGPSFTVALDGATITNGTVSSDQPAQTTLMGPIHYMENTIGASKTYSCYKAWIEADN